MGTNPLTAIAEATQFPKNWGLYWTLRMQHAFSIEEACKAMREAEYEGWTQTFYMNPEALVLRLRKLEMLCNALECCEPAPCKCPRCQ